jgi:hypothetical protein
MIGIATCVDVPSRVVSILVEKPTCIRQKRQVMPTENPKMVSAVQNVSSWRRRIWQGV